jgi:hypothetical protein
MLGLCHCQLAVISQLTANLLLQLSNVNKLTCLVRAY